MNDSDTEFVAEDESVISTNIIRKEEIDDQCSSVSVREASIHILFTQNKDGTNTLGQDKPNNVLPISHLLLPINVLQISHLLLPLSVLPISHLLMLLLDVVPISHPIYSSFYSYSTQKHQETESKLDDQRQNEKEKGQCSIRREQHKLEKRAVSRKRKTKQRRKNQYDRGMEMGV